MHCLGVNTDWPTDWPANFPSDIRLHSSYNVHFVNSFWNTYCISASTQDLLLPQHSSRVDREKKGARREKIYQKTHQVATMGFWNQFLLRSKLVLFWFSTYVNTADKYNQLSYFILMAFSYYKREKRSTEWIIPQCNLLGLNTHLNLPGYKLGVTTERESHNKPWQSVHTKSPDYKALFYPLRRFLFCFRQYTRS